MRSRLATVVRVAALRETVARAAVAAATVARDEAERDRAARLVAVGQCRLVGGTASELVAAAAVAAGRAAAVNTARHRLDERVAERGTALAAWSSAARRQQGLEDLADRLRRVEEAETERSDQRNVDDLTGQRRNRREDA